MYYFKLFLIALLATIIGIINAHEVCAAGNSRLEGEKRTVMENLPGQVGALFKWPDLEAIPTGRLMTGAENKHTLRAKRGSIRWVRRIIDDKWLPESKEHLEDGLVMVKEEYDSVDATHVEWEKNGYLFHITQSRTVFTVTITPVTGSNAISGNTLQEKIASASRLCEQIIRNIPTVESTAENKKIINIAPEGTRNLLLKNTFTMGIVKQCDDGIVGRPARIDSKNDLDSRSYNYWWRRTGWWTRGRSLQLYTLKTQGGAWRANYSHRLDDMWFEGSPYGRKTKN